MALSDVIEKVETRFKELFESEIDLVKEQAQEDPVHIYEMTEDKESEVLLVWGEVVDEIAVDVNAFVNEELGESETQQVTEDDTAIHKVVGGFYALQSFQQGYRRIHSSSIALQIPEEEREQEVQQAVEKANEDVARVPVVEVAFIYGVLNGLEQTRRGIDTYIWDTQKDKKVRPTHAAKQDKIIRWDTPPPDTGHVGEDHGCRCSAKPNKDTQSSKDTGVDMPNCVISSSKLDKNNQKGMKVFDKNAMAIGDGAKRYIYVSGIIGDDWDLNTTDWQIAEFNGLQGSDVEEIHVMINSIGGSSAHGVAIYNYLMMHPAKVFTYNMADASSAASLIFLAGDERYMPKGTEALIHNPWACGCFNHNDVEGFQSYMKDSSEAMVDIYEKHLKIPREEIRQILDGETIVYSERALEIGFSTSDEMPSSVAEVESSPDTEAKKLASKLAANSLLNMAVVNSMKKGGNTTMPKNTQSGTSEGSKTDDVAALQAKNQVLETQLKAEKDEVTRLKAEAEKGETEEAMRTRIRAEMKAEATELAEAKAALQKAGIETKSEADNPMQFKREVLKERGVENADNADEMPDTAISSTFAYAVTISGGNDAGGEDLDGLINAEDGESEDPNGEKNVFANMKPVK